jgi:hypothetical protein
MICRFVLCQPVCQRTRKHLSIHLGGFNTKKSRGACHENPVSSPPPAPRRVFFAFFPNYYGAIASSRSCDLNPQRRYPLLQVSHSGCDFASHLMDRYRMRPCRTTFFDVPLICIVTTQDCPGLRVSESTFEHSSNFANLYL